LFDYQNKTKTVMSNPRCLNTLKLKDNDYSIWKLPD